MVTKAKAAPADGAAVIDLDARKAARQEKSGETKHVRWGGRLWEFVPELPLLTMERFSDSDLRGAFALILAEPKDAVDFLMAGNFSNEDFATILREVYGMDLPDASA